jgi:hypothetical protein
MLRPILLVKIGLGGLVFAARWGQNGNGHHPEEASEALALEGPGDFLRRHLEYELSGEFARSWDDLHPAHQMVVTRERYAECRAELFERSGPTTELRSFEVLEVADDAGPIAGIDEPGAKAVTAEITIGVNGNSRSVLDTLHAVDVDGRWTWVFPERVYDAYASGSRPAATS